MGTRLVYHIDKSLGIIFRERFEYLDLIGVREEGLYQLNPLVRGNLRADQPLPGGRVPTHGEIVKLRGG